MLVVAPLWQVDCKKWKVRVETHATRASCDRDGRCEERVPSRRHGAQLGLHLHLHQLGFSRSHHVSHLFSCKQPALAERRSILTAAENLIHNATRYPAAGRLGCSVLGHGVRHSAYRLRKSDNPHQRPVRLTPEPLAPSMKTWVTSSASAIHLCSTAMAALFVTSPLVLGPSHA